MNKQTIRICIRETYYTNNIYKPLAFNPMLVDNSKIESYINNINKYTDRKITIKYH